MATAADRIIQCYGTPMKRQFTATAAIIYGGDLVMINGDGNALSATDTAGAIIAGIAESQCAASGTVTVLDCADFLIPHASAATTDINTVAYADDSGGGDDSDTNTLIIGGVVGVATNMWRVHINYGANIVYEILQTQITTKVV